MSEQKATNVHWHDGEINRPERAQLLGHGGATLWFTGLSGSGKSTIAVALEQALYQRGGEDWDTYYKQMSAWLIKQQRNDGSWQGDGVGTVYGTAIALTILQLPYSYAPIYQR